MEWTKRDGILTAAAKAFESLGFKKSSIDQIARAAGVAKGTIYLACSSKEDLFYQVLHREVRAWCAEVSKVLDPRVPADRLLDIAATKGVEYLEARPLVKALLFGEYHTLLPGWEERLDALRKIGRENVIEILKLGQKQGIYRDELDLEEIATLLLDLQVAFYVLHDHGPDRKARMSRRKRVALDLILNGLRRPAAGAGPNPES
jgi:AcrR family transcriptional regulator